MTETEILFDGPRPEQIYLFDMKGISFGHLFKLSLGLIRKGMRFVEDAIPMDIKAIHILNATTHLNFIMSNKLLFTNLIVCQLINLSLRNGQALREIKNIRKSSILLIGHQLG